MYNGICALDVNEAHLDWNWIAVAVAVEPGPNKHLPKLRCISHTVNI